MKKGSFLKLALGMVIAVSITLTGSLVWADPCEPDPCDPGPCEPDPCIIVEKECYQVTDAEIAFQITVNNCSDIVALSDVYIVDNDNTLDVGDGGLNPGETSGAIIVTYGIAGCGQITNTVTAFGTYQGLCGPEVITYSDTVTCGEPCNGENCTYTPGYWKNHLEKWGDIKTTDTLPNSPSKTYLQILQNPPQGNAYWILARAYIAALLNQDKGASIDDISGELDDAKDLFDAYDDAAVLTLKKSKLPEDKEKYQEFIDLAEILDKYNNNEDGIGPGHCD